MSKAAKKLAPLDPIANTAVSGEARGLIDPRASIESEKRKKEGASTGGGAGGTPAERAKQVADTREAMALTRVKAAGAVGTENEAALLGTYGLEDTPAKRKSVSRTLLG